jgi:hypothetical protein
VNLEVVSPLNLSNDQWPMLGVCKDLSTKNSRGGLKEKRGGVLLQMIITGREGKSLCCGFI